MKKEFLQDYEKKEIERQREHYRRVQDQKVGDNKS